MSQDFHRRRESLAPKRAEAMSREAPPRRSKWLIRIWLCIALIWVLAAGFASVRPIAGAIAQARDPHAFAAAPPPKSINGVPPQPPDSPTVVAAKIIARQAALVFAPPLLALWFGWDLWFAVAGFLEGRVKRRPPG